MSIPKNHILGGIVAALILIGGIYVFGGKEVTPEVVAQTEPPSVYEYASTVITAMGYADEAKDLLQESAKSPDSDIYSGTMESLIATRKAINKLRTAASLFDDYASTTNKLLSENSLHYQSAYIALASLLEESAQIEESALQIQTEADIGTYVSKISKSVASLDETWKVLPWVTAELTYVLLDQERLDGENITRLLLTDSERENLVNQLDGIFGTEIRNGMQVGQLAIVASGAALRDFLVSEWKSADDE